MNEGVTELKGVKGWLLLLCLLLTIFDPFVVLVTLFVVSDGARASYDANPPLFRLILISGVLRIGLAVFSMYAGISLWRIAPRAVSTARRYLASVAFLAVFLLFLPSLLGLSNEETWGLNQENLLNTLLTVIYAAAWYAYLSKSKRVRATYFPGSERVSGIEEG
jgi:hypothetical protein